MLESEKLRAYAADAMLHGDTELACTWALAALFAGRNECRSKMARPDGFEPPTSVGSFEPAALYL